MGSRNICSRKRSIELKHPNMRRIRGFSLIEVIIVTAIAVILFSLGTLFTIDSYRATNFRHEVQTLVTLLQTARASAMNNMGQSAHGVAFSPPDHPGHYVLFAGQRYVESAIVSLVREQHGIELDTSGPREVVFEQLSGAVHDGVLIYLKDTQRGISATISINPEGQISW